MSPDTRISEVAAKLDSVVWWVGEPNNRNHPYNDKERESAEWPTIERSPAVQALMDAGLVAEYLDKLTYQLMGMAKAEGDTWEQIGETLGITKQAAQQRFAAWERKELDDA